MGSELYVARVVEDETRRLGGAAIARLTEFDVDLERVLALVGRKRGEARNFSSLAELLDTLAALEDPPAISGPEKLGPELYDPAAVSWLQGDLTAAPEHLLPGMVGHWLGNNLLADLAPAAHGHARSRCCTVEVASIHPDAGFPQAGSEFKPFALRLLCDLQVEPLAQRKPFAWFEQRASGSFFDPDFGGRREAVEGIVWVAREQRSLDLRAGDAGFWKTHGNTWWARWHAATGGRRWFAPSDHLPYQVRRYAFYLHPSWLGELRREPTESRAFW